MGFIDRATGWSLGLWLVAVGLIAEQHSPWLCKLGPSDWAAWVQAFGSIGAIAGTFAVFNAQRQHERLVKQQEAVDQQTRTIEGARRVVLGGINVCLTVARSLDHGMPTGSSAELILLGMDAELTGVAQTLRKVDAHLLDSADLTEAVLTSAACMDHLRSVGASCLDPKTMSEESYQRLRMVCDNVGQWLSARHARLAKECIRRGVPVEDESTANE